MLRACELWTHLQFDTKDESVIIFHFSSTFFPLSLICLGLLAKRH